MDCCGDGLSNEAACGGGVVLFMRCVEVLSI